MMKKSSLLFIVVILSLSGFGQIQDYNFKRDIKGISETWHSIEIPNDLFMKIDESMNDIRLYGITENNDTVEAPYFIQFQKDIVSIENISYQLINESRNEKGYYYSLQLNKEENINEMQLNFGLSNYDWQISVEGSQDQLNWFTLVENYRVLSIHNEFTDYAFNRISFPESKYRYYRIFIPSSINPNLISPSITYSTYTKGKTRDVQIKSQTISVDNTNKETIIDIQLKETIPLNKISLSASDDFDYYRLIHIEYLSDSTKTEKGYILNYRDINAGIFSSIEPNEFNLNNIQTNNLRVRISNNDNQALDINEITINGYVYELIARFTEEADYIMSYGKPNDNQPNYDIDHFTSNIPDGLSTLELGDEISIASDSEQKSQEEESGFFSNPILLWSIMGFIILVLGWFTLKMIKSESNKTDSK